MPSAVDPGHVSVGPGVNISTARTVSLTALALIPAVSGLTTASGAAEVAHACRTALVLAAASTASAAPIAYIELSRRRALDGSRGHGRSAAGPTAQSPASKPAVLAREES